MNKTDLKIFDSLSIVTIRGFEPETETFEIEGGGTHTVHQCDPPGCANFLVDSYGLQYGEPDPEHRGILWTDYEGSGGDPWAFDLLIATHEVDALKTVATEAGYDFVKTEKIDEPMQFGDGDEVVTILKHPNGWVLVS